MNRQIYKMTLSDASDSITFYLLEVPIADDDITGTARNTTIDGNVYEDYLWLKKQWSQKWSIMCKDEYDKLRGIWKRQYTDSEVVSVKYFYGDNIYTDGEVEGDTMQINNDSEVYEGEIRTVKLLGNTTQKTLSGKNLADLVPMTNGTITGANHATVETINDSTLGRQVIHITATSSYPTAKYMLPARLESGCYYALTLRYKTAYTGTGNEIQQALWVAPNWSGNSWDMIGSWQHAKNESGTTDPVAKVPQSSTWKVATFRFYADPTQYAYASASYTFIALSLGYGISAQNTSKEAWFADIMLTEITQAEWNATTYKDEEFEKYVGGIPSPNPDFSQVVNTVSGLQTVKFVGNNILDIKPSDVRATSAGLTLTRGDDGSISYIGSPSQTYAFITTEVNAVYEAGNYTFSIGDNINTDANIYLRFKMQDGTETIVQVDKNTGTNSNIILTQPTVSYVLAFRGMTTNVQIAGTVKPQFEIANNEFDSSVLPATWTNTTAVYKTLNLKPNTSYALSSDIPRASGNALLFFLEAGQTIGTNTNGVWDGQSRTLMTDSTGNNLQIAYRSFSGETRTRDDYKYLLSSPSTYEPYKEINYGINLGGQNLFDQSLMGNDENKGITLNSTRDRVEATGTTDSTYYPSWVVFGDGTLTKTNWWPTASTVDITKGQFCDSTPHTLSIEVGGATVVANTIAFWVGYTDGTYSGNLFIGAGATSAKITTNKAINFIAIGFKGGDVPINNTFKIQLVEGDKALPFASYTTYQHELAKIGTYQDYIWNDDGTWKIHKAIDKVVLTGSENWGLSGDTRNNQYFTTDGITNYPAGYDSAGKAICDHFSPVPSNQTYATKTIIGFGGWEPSGGQIRIGFDANIVDRNLADFKTWLSAHPTTVYYASDTPTDTEITDAELVGQLEALLAGSLYKGLNNVFLIPSAGAQGTMTLDYRIDYEKETVVQDTTPVLLDLTDDGIINACQCRQNVKITMRETVQ